MVFSIALAWLGPTFENTALGQASLAGIKCDSVPREPATKFASPTTPIDNLSWTITNGFGNVVTNADIKGLPAGYWQHTGIDYVLGGSTKSSEKRTVYSAASGIVIFSTLTPSNVNPVPKRGGLVIIKHSVDRNSARYQIPEYRKTFFAGSNFTISYPAFQTTDLYTYYLHLDPNKIKVALGDSVSIGQPIAETYSYEDFVQGNYAYPPHLHFEVWKSCGAIERNGYDSANSEFAKAVNDLLLNPLQQIGIISLSARPVVSASLRISQSGVQSPGPFQLGMPLMGVFTIANRGNADLSMRQLLIAGRFNGDQCPSGRCPDFAPIYIDRVLRPNDTFIYTGNFTPSLAGTYTFTVAYEKPDRNWQWPVASENGSINQLNVVVRKADGPTLLSASPASLAASPYKQTLTLSGTGLTKTIYVELTLPSGAKKNIYLPLRQVFSGMPDRLRLETEFRYRGRYQIIAHTPLHKTNAFIFEVR